MAFSSQDLDVSIHFDAVDGRPAFDARNATVGNEFYLYDGPIGAKHWVHDTTATHIGGKRRK